jgi:hypothetical protein
LDVVGWIHGHPQTGTVLGITAVLGATVLVRGTALAVARARHRRLSRHARQVTITPPPQVDRTGAVVFWATLADLLASSLRRRWRYGNAHVALEYRWSARRLTLVCWVPGVISAMSVAAAVRAAWPGAITRVEDDATPPVPVALVPAGADQRVADKDGVPRLARRPARYPAKGGAMTLALPAGHPLRTDYDADPLRPLIQTMADLHTGEHAAVQILARPATPRQATRLRARAVQLRTGHPGTTGSGGLLAGLLEGTLRAGLDLLTPGPTRPRASTTGRAASGDPLRDRDARATTDAAAGPLWEVAVRYAVVHTNPRAVDPTPLQARLTTRVDAVAAAFGVHTARNRLRRLPLPDPASVLAARALVRGFLLPADQLAALAGLPADVAVPGLDRAGAKPAPAPVAVPGGGRGTKPLGRAQVGGHAVALPVVDARQHLHVLGSTGSGKSTFLTHLILDDIANRRGVVVIDPKGDLATDVLDRLPASVADRLVVIDPDQPGGATLNPLAGADHDLVVDNIVAIFANIFARHWGPRIDDVLRVACLTLMRHPRATLVTIPPLLNDAQFRAPFIADLTDPEGLRGFWDWFNTSPPALRAQVIGPVLARLRAFLLRDFVRATLGTPTSSFETARVLDSGVLIARLPKGQLGEDTARLMASFVLASVWEAATARTRQPEDRRRDASVYVDEAHNVLNLAGSVSDMLAEARGYRLSLVLAHQDLAQFPRDTVLAISANARNKVFFACSPEDARQLARHTLPDLDEHDLAHLDAYTAAARLVIDARLTPAFTLQTRPPRPTLGQLAQLRQKVASSRSTPAPASGGTGGRSARDVPPARPPGQRRPARSRARPRRERRPRKPHQGFPHGDHRMTSSDRVLRLQARLTSRDRRLLDWLSDHQVLTTPQIDHALFGSRRVTQRRLLTLHQLQLLDRFRPLRPGGGSYPWHHVLGQVGAELVAAVRDQPPPRPSETARRARRIATSRVLDHRLGVNQFFTDLAGHARTHPGTRLERWWSEARCAAPGAFAPGLVSPIRPDGHGIWTDNGRRVGFYLEYDTGTEDLHTVLSKLARYDTHVVRGGPTWPVLFWLPSPARERHLHTLLHERQSSITVATATCGADAPGPATTQWRVVGQHHIQWCRLVDLSAFCTE